MSNQSSFDHIALIGCGFTGTSAFYQLVDRCPVKNITIFEASGEFGPGYPYHPDECQDYLINNPTSTMCLTPSNRRAFYNWLVLQDEFGPETDPNGHLPRAVFGRFLKDVFASTRTNAAIKGIEVKLVPFEATGMFEEADGQVSVSWAGGEVKVDKAILTTGRCPGLDPYPSPPEGSKATYIRDHIQTTEFDKIPLDASIHVLGASLSAYDVINRIFSPDTGCRFERDSSGELVFVSGQNNRNLALVSRSGRMKSFQSRKSSKIPRENFTLEKLTDSAGLGKVTLNQVAEAIQQDMAEQGISLDWDKIKNPYHLCRSQDDTNVRAIELLHEAINSAATGTNYLVDYFGGAQKEIWDAFACQLLDLESEQAYREKYETAMLCYVAVCPVPTAEKILALLRAGRITVIKGVTDVKLNDDGEYYEISHQFGTERAQVLINTTGSVDRGVSSDTQPDLIKSLRDSGQLNIYQRGGVAMKGADVDMKNYRLPNTQNIYMANMLLWGPGFFTSSAHLMASIVENILNGIYGPPHTSKSNRD